MAGYTRQSLATIINGANITAPPLNAEFNQISAAFNSSSGHSHDGTSGNSPKINLTTSVAGYLPAEHGGIGGKNKLDATTTPTVTDDNNDGYAPGSLWEDTTTGRIYICVGNSTGAAVWRELVQVNSGTAILPAATDTVDLGDNSNRFQDLFLSGGISASGNVAAGGTLNITGATALGSTLGVTGDTTLVNLSATGTTVINSIDLNSGAIDSTTIGTTTPAAGSFTTLNANTSLVAATADINGGSVDGATIGASTPSTGSFTTLGASGTSTLATVDINGGNIDGTAIGAAVQSTGAFTTVSTSGQATLATVDINGGSIDGTAIGGNSTSSGAFTTLSASGGITGDIVGNVTGNSSGTHTGAVVGNVTGNLTGNITSSGTSSFNNVTVDGTLNMNAGTTATITNLTDPTNAQDAATKAYVDGEISTLIGDAGAGLNTLGELADALNDDDDFSTTVTNSIATKLPKAGGTMTGAIAMSNNKITGLGSPSVGTDASTKDYVDTQRNTRVAKTGDTMSGALAMGSNKITGLGTPTAGTDATTKTYVDGILGSATASSASASAAATSESNAATSETNAASSASAAAADRATVASLYDSFDDRYLGPKSSAPTQDNDGNALVIGALYFNSTNNIMYVYGSGGWQAAGSSVNGTSDRQTYTATAGQTVFAATYDAGYVDVYLNGVKLLAGTDFTATNGTSITLASGASVNDVVDIVAYGTFVLADHLTETQSDAKYVEVAGDTMTGALTTTGVTVGNSNIGSNTSHLANMTINNNGYIGSASATTALQIPTGGGINVEGSGRFANSAATPVRLHINNSGSNDYASLYADTTSAYKNLVINLNGGNVTVGTIDDAVWNDTTGDGGINLRSDGILAAARNGGEPLLLNRIGTDGELIKFKKNGSDVGSIGNRFGAMYIHSPDGTNGAGLRFFDGVIQPCESNGNDSNGDTDLGQTNSRFKDLYLSGKIQLGGTGAEKLYVEGTNPRLYVKGDSNSYYPSIRVDGVNGGISLGTYYGGNISAQNSLTFLTGDSATDGGSPRLQIRSDNDIEIRNLQSAAGGVDTNALYWKIQNSANTGQYARLGGIKAETVSAWGGKLKFYTKPANGTPNDTVTEQMVIDQAGRVTMPYQPSFMAYAGGDVGFNAPQSTWTDLNVFGSVNHNRGNHYNSSTCNFTCPVSGVYHFYVNVREETYYGTWGGIHIQLVSNGSRFAEIRKWDGYQNEETLTLSVTRQFSANDVVGVRVHSDSSDTALSVEGGNTTFFGGHLLG